MKNVGKIDSKKVWQIFSVYVLALIAAVICGTSIAKITSSPQTQSENQNQSSPQK